MNNHHALRSSVTKLAQLALKHRQMLATAESCTGGMIAAAFTEISGSSDWFDRGFITYSNSAKQQMLGVTDEILQEHGAVSQATVEAMASGAVTRSNANLAVSVSGVAGPTGGSAEKPVGTVWIACAGDVLSRAKAVHHHFDGDRQSVRMQTVQQAIEMLMECIESESS